ncbi:MAG: polymerase beta domain protein region [Massilia sp.]|nr:polymerase beta domain protein region [Massilia sp.]
MTFRQILEQHQPLQHRRKESQKKLDSARAVFRKERVFQENEDICVFAAGSLGRLESGSRSDLDVFVTATENGAGRLREIEVFSSILNVNTQQGFPELSNDGQFLKIFGVKQNEEKIGSPNDDNENWFTTRMLLLLESNYLCNEAAYHDHKRKILGFYFRDSAQQEGFRPVFLLNDVLRYWRTLCLNYELARSGQNKSWKKRNLNLRYSRLLTVFGTVLPLMLIKDVSVEKIEELSSYTPMERLARGLEMLGSAPDLEADFPSFLDFYEEFLSIKETTDFNEVDDDVRAGLKDKADYIAKFVYRALNHSTVPEALRRYLVI